MSSRVTIRGAAKQDLAEPSPSAPAKTSHMARRNPILNYSSSAEEQKRERSAEEERREAVRRYNEGTFGERRPIAFAFLRLAIFLALLSTVIIFLPRSVGRVLGALTTVAYVAWEARKSE